MAKQQIEGPYKVKQINEKIWEVGDTSSGQWVPLNPRKRFQQNNARQSAYRSMARLNRRYQRESKEDLVEVAC